MMESKESTEKYCRFERVRDGRAKDAVRTKHFVDGSVEILSGKGGIRDRPGATAPGPQDDNSQASSATATGNTH
jgi:hypothetical protein